jgi:cobalt-zinc-cadmium efflux system membrane fusion protein
MPALVSPSTSAKSRTSRSLLITAGVVAIAVAAAAVWRGTRSPSREPPTLSAGTSPAAENRASKAEAPGKVTLPKSTWSVAGIEVAPAKAARMTDSVEVTGKVALNEDRIAHVYPIVEGRVEEVRVRFGQDVKAGDVLAIIQSKEVGQRKLELVQSRLAQEIASIHRDRAVEVDRNAQELITALEGGVSIDDIETKFRGRPMGDFRERLVTAYAGLAKATADYDRLSDLTNRGVTATKDLTSAKAARDAARATYVALLDQCKFDAHQQAVAANQALREADARVAAGESALQILGYPKSDLANIDPAKEGEAISHYPVFAPFDGTILTKDIVLLESVGPSRQLFQIADLSTVWIVADVYERHLPILEGLQGKSVRVHSDAIFGLTTDAKVFFTGETVEESSRTIRLRAEAPNPERRLKPGLFVEIELPGSTSETVVQVPESAVVEHAGQTFVFVSDGGDAFTRRDVTTGRHSDGSVQIVKGLKAGEPVAVRGTFALKSRLLSDLLSEE